MKNAKSEKAVRCQHLPIGVKKGKDELDLESVC